MDGLLPILTELSDISLHLDTTSMGSVDRHLSGNSSFWAGNKSMDIYAPNGCLVFRFEEYVPWDNPYDVITYRGGIAYEATVDGVILPILCLVGSFTNVINMLVFAKHGLKERVNLSLFLLAGIDFIYILQAFIFYSEILYRRANHLDEYGSLFKFFFENSVVGLFGFMHASAFTTTIIACERCFCVVSPLKLHSLLKTRTMGVIIVVSSLLLVAGFMVVCSTWNIQCVFDTFTNTTSWMVFANQFFLDNVAFLTVLDSIVYGVFIPGFFCAIVITATAITAVRLRKLSEWRKATSSAAAFTARDIILTRMIVATSTMFIICLSPCVLRFLILCVPGLTITGRLYNSYNVLLHSAQFGSYVNSSVDFFVYYRYGSKFRHTVRCMFCAATEHAKTAHQHMKPN